MAGVEEEAAVEEGADKEARAETAWVGAWEMAGLGVVGARVGERPGPRAAALGARVGWGWAAGEPAGLAVPWEGVPRAACSGAVVEREGVVGLGWGARARAAWGSAAVVWARAVRAQAAGGWVAAATGAWAAAEEMEAAGRGVGQQAARAEWAARAGRAPAARCRRSSQPDCRK
jgi:hypothetical protein